MSAVQTCYIKITEKLEVSSKYIELLNLQRSRGDGVVFEDLEELSTISQEGHEGLEALKLLSEQNNGEGPDYIASVEAILTKLGEVIMDFKAMALKDGLYHRREYSDECGRGN
ncbi:hypothetical protein L211DRAFT_572130 [Terfezia boudieri ATCC MYA-4762]|uniref:Uncharacterized protein n=1 Tax=Terfezia boudieri ATCC MYA-4762 TaxID=1051890 RepID=A0A3N4LBV9_9PEZI|nr:hypothetical protein L211DRAFT_572130 [Terfezia boudieri ATCC MYA-4762]